MARITRDRRCHVCGNQDFSRRHRRFWMRWFSGSELLQCRNCRASILLLGANRSRDSGDDLS